MAKPRTSMYLDGHTYSQFDPEEVHRDMRLDPTRAQAVMARSKGVAVLHEFCDDCRAIVAEHAADKSRVAGGYDTLDAAIIAHSDREAKYVISRANLARMLLLGSGERITRMWVDHDTRLLHVVIAAEHFKPVADGIIPPVLRMSRTEAAAKDT